VELKAFADALGERGLAEVTHLTEERAAAITAEREPRSQH
jgi:hypothetical protein